MYKIIQKLGFFLFILLLSCSKEEQQTPNYIGKWFYAQEKISYFNDEALIGDSNRVISYFDFWAFNNNNLFVYSDIENGIKDKVGTYNYINKDSIAISFFRENIEKFDTFSTVFDIENDTAVFRLKKNILNSDTAYMIKKIKLLKIK